VNIQYFRSQTIEGEDQEIRIHWHNFDTVQTAAIHTVNILDVP